MALPSTPSNFYLQTGNMQNFLSWDISVSATSYEIQRSTDGVNYANYANVTVNNYLDSAVTVGTQYFYQVASVNVSGTSPYTAPQSVVPTPSGEMSLGQIRLAAQQRADRVGSNFVTLPEWNSYINQSMFELYDLLIDTYQDYYVAPPVQVIPDGTTYLYPLPDGINNGGAAPFYKLLGVDLSLNTAQNAWVTINRFMFIDRNRFVYPNTASTIYGVFNLQYMLLGSNIQFIPTPSAGQIIRFWYIPRLKQLLQDTDVTVTGISGWIEYVILRAAILALTKQEGDTTALVQQLLDVRKRIEDSAPNRDAGAPPLISDARQNGWWGSMNGGYGSNGPVGGF